MGDLLPRIIDQPVPPEFLHDLGHGLLLFWAAVDLQTDDERRVGRHKAVVPDGFTDIAE